ncbi:hypothetical protein, conserved [Plasmodium gonderi]|uniref:Uncharacterized protein n=1 Tax=Plasmodium gonderi TaxID=77519 RepID=A0A1Y1JHB6_PLAGO|nr:hypothetical protein, conserved [Plasmodium gonderi]GAW80607.1 hypothetical protein, conserved [Plasmodium gonderi]
MDRKTGCVYKIKESMRGKNICNTHDEDTCEIKKKGCVLRHLNDQGDDLINNSVDVEYVNKIHSYNKNRIMHCFENIKENYNLEPPVCSYSNARVNDKEENSLNNKISSNESISMSNVKEEQILILSNVHETAYHKQRDESLSNDSAEINNLLFAKNEVVNVVNSFSKEKSIEDRIKQGHECIYGDVACGAYSAHVNDFAETAHSGGDENISEHDDYGDFAAISSFASFGDSSYPACADVAGNITSVAQSACPYESDQWKDQSDVIQSEPNVKEEESEGDNEIKKILDVLQNLKNYKFQDTNNFDNDIYYEHFDDDVENEEANKNKIGTYFQEKNTPFLENKYLFKGPNAKTVDTTAGSEKNEEEEYLDLQKLKEKYKKYNFSLSENDEEEEAENMKQSNLEMCYRRLMEDICCNNNEMEKIDKSNESQREKEEKNEATDENYPVDAHIFHTNNNEDLHNSLNTFNRVKKKKRKKKSEKRGGEKVNEVKEVKAGEYPEHCTDEFTGLDILESNSYRISSNSFRRHDSEQVDCHETDSRDGRKNNDRNVSNNSEYLKGLNHNGIPRNGKYDYSDSSETNMNMDVKYKPGDLQKSGKCEPNEKKDKTEFNQNEKKKEQDEATQNEVIHDGASIDGASNDGASNDGGAINGASNEEYNNTTDSPIPAKKDQVKFEEKIRKRKLLKENMKSLKNKEKNKLNEGENSNVNENEGGNAAPNMNTINLNLNIPVDMTKSVPTTPYNELSEKIRNIMNSNDNDQEDKNNLEFDHYLSKLHNLKSLLRQEISQSDEDDKKCNRPSEEHTGDDNDEDDTAQPQKEEKIDIGNTECRQKYYCEEIEKEGGKRNTMLRIRSFELRDVDRTKKKKKKKKTIKRSSSSGRRRRRRRSKKDDKGTAQKISVEETDRTSSKEEEETSGGEDKEIIHGEADQDDSSVEMGKKRKGEGKKNNNGNTDNSEDEEKTIDTDRSRASSHGSREIKGHIPKIYSKINKKFAQTEVQTKSKLKAQEHGKGQEKELEQAELRAESETQERTSAEVQSLQIELIAEKNKLLKRGMKNLQREMVRYKKMEKMFYKNKEKYKKKLTLVNEYEKKIDYMIVDFKKLKETCTIKEKKLAKFEEITKYMNDQFSVSKIQFENKMNEYVLFLKKKDSEIYMLKELIKEKENIISFNENILKQYKNDIDDMLRQNIERVEHVKGKLKAQQDMITGKDEKIKMLEQNIHNYSDQINKMDNEIKKLLYQIDLDNEKGKELKINYDKEKEKNVQLSNQIDQISRENKDLHYKIENLLQNEKNIMNSNVELVENQKVLCMENEKMKNERNLLINEKTQIEEKYNTISAEHNKINEQVVVLKKGNDKQEIELAKLREELAIFEKKNAKLKEEKEQVEKLSLKQTGETDSIKNSLEETKKKMLNYMNERNELKEIVDDLKKKNDALTSKNEQEGNIWKEEIEDLKAKLEESNKLYCKEKEVIENLSKGKNKFIKECEKLKNKNKKITSKLKENEMKMKESLNQIMKEKKEYLEKEKNNFSQKVQSLEQAFQISYNEIHEQNNSLKVELDEVKIINEDLKKNSQNLLNVNEVLTKEMKAYNEEKEKFIKGLKNIKQAYLKIKSENEQLKKNAFEFIKEEVEQNYVSLSVHNNLMNEQKNLLLEKDMLRSQLKENETLIMNLNKDKSEISENLIKISKENEELNTNIRVKNKITEDVTANVEKLKVDLNSKDEEVKRKTLELKKMERDYKKLLEDYKIEKKNLISKYENELDTYMSKCEFAHVKYKTCEEEIKELKNKLKMKDDVIEYTHKEIENIKESFCNEYECKIKNVVEEKDKEMYAIQKKYRELQDDNNMRKNEIIKLNKMFEDANKKIKKRDMEMYILLEENKKQKEKAAKKMTKVNELLNNLQKEYTNNIP